jgi:hypothetical protein
LARAKVEERNLGERDMSTIITSEYNDLKKNKLMIISDKIY